MVEKVDFSVFYDNNISVKKLKKTIRKLRPPENKYRFGSDVQREVFKALFKEDFKEMEEEYDSAFNNYAHRILDIGQEKEANKYFRKAEEINPIEESYIQPQINFHIALEQYDKAYENIMKLFAYAHNKSLLLDSYDFLSYYYNKIGNEELEKVADYFLRYCDNEIKSPKFREPFDEEMVRKAKDNNIPTTFNKKIIEHYKKLYKNEEDITQKQYYQHVLVSLRCYEYEDDDLGYGDFIFESTGKIKEHCHELNENFLILDCGRNEVEKYEKELGIELTDNNVIFGVAITNNNKVELQNPAIVVASTGTKDENNIMKIDSIDIGSVIKTVVADENRYVLNLKDIQELEFMNITTEHTHHLNKILKTFDKTIRIN